MTWRLIKTAPKDGTRILVACNRVVQGFPESRRGPKADFWHTTEGHGFEGWGKFNKSYFPATHWKPLPDPSEAA